MCIKLTDVYYDHLCRPGGHAPTLAATVLNDERVQAIRVEGRPIVTAIVKGAEKPPSNADLVAWSK